MSRNSTPQAREPRQPVTIGARLKSQRGWSDMVIRNVSSRGMMGVCREAPTRGDYVEIRSGSYVVVARIAWADGTTFGARSQHPIHMNHLVAGSRHRAPGRDRRLLPRAPRAAPRRTPADIAAASARAGRWFEFVAVAVAGAALAGIAGGCAYQALAAPLDRAARAMSGSEMSGHVK